MGSTLTNLIFHVVFSTKNRERIINDDVRKKLYQYMGGIIKGEGGTSLSIGGTTDHVHLLLKIPASIALSDMLRKLKSNSSKWINEQQFFGFSFSWQRGYAAFSVSRSMLGSVSAYIENQEEHHRKASFKEELIAFLEKHGIEYDERYVFSE